MDRAAPVSASAAVGEIPDCSFGRFTLEPAQRRLLMDGQPVSLGARAFDLLVVLVARAGRLVSKQELLTSVWPGLVVEENNLQVQVSSLRKLLGSSALATIPGRGYRFELPVQGKGGASLPPVLVCAGAAPTGDAGASPALTSTSLTVPVSESSAGTTRAYAGSLPDRAPTNIPPRLSPLYGRVSDLDAIKDLLARHVLVTIVGAGGIGKTRVAQMVAAQLAVERAGDFPDGVWWVELAPLADGEHVVATVARVLDTQLSAERPPVDTIAAVLAAQRALLVLDNCEHVSDAVASLVEVACAKAPGLRVLATSQETLKTADEQVYRLGALDVPAANAGAEAVHAGAVALFFARVQGVDPRFALTHENRQAVVEICRRLDGIPLAIELAASRVPLLGVEGLRARLDERFRVLTAGARAVLRRHQTLRATLEWSHSLLTPDEQTVFRRLGVFAGSFTLEAAQYVAQDARIDAWTALDHLGALVDKSLVLAEGNPVPRYRLLESARAYALERLGEAGETDATLRRHAEALLELLIGFEHDEQDKGPAIGEKNAKAAELDNLRAALSWAAADRASEELRVALIANSVVVWYSVSLLQEGMEHALAVRPLVREALPLAVRARYWLTVARLGVYSTRRESFDAARHAADLYLQLGDDRRRFGALVVGAAQGIRFGTCEDMGRAIAEADSLVRPDWPAWKRVSLEWARSRWYLRQGRMEDAIAAALRQSTISEQGGSEQGKHYALSSVIAIELHLGRTEVGLARARSSIHRLEAIGGEAGAGHLWLQVLGAEAVLGNVDAAVAAGRTAYALLLCEGDELQVFWGLALCAALRGRLDDAGRILGYAESVLARAGTIDESPLTTISRRLAPLLDAGLGVDVQARLRAEGAAMRETDAVRLALGDAG